jgi:hypothetical protein
VEPLVGIEPTPAAYETVARPSSQRGVTSRWWELNPTTLVWRTSVSPQHFTCLAVSGETWFADHRRRGARSMVQAWVEWELNPRFVGVRTRCNASVCYRPGRPTLWNRTRTSRASAERADQLRKSGMACRARPEAPARHVFRSGACQGTLIIIDSSVVRDLPRRAQGAPRAVMRSRRPRMHQSRNRDLDC